jgi:hypothetical protein
MPEELAACLQAYADGVNEYVESTYFLPFEFFLIGVYKWEKITI